MDALNLQILTALEPAADGRQRLLGLVRLETRYAEEADRPPLHVALILDRSSSMRGRPMELVKDAADHFLRKLTRRDFATAISYSTKAEVVVPHTPLTDKAGFVATLRRIEPHGNTNLSDGWQAGLDELEPHRQAGHFCLALLLTDGRANQGLTDPSDLLAMAEASALRGIRTSTIGVGSDFDENLLREVARVGRGRYHQVRELTALEAAFTRELEEVMALAAHNAQVSLEVSEQAVRAGLDLQVAWNSHEGLTPAGGPAAVFALGDLAEGDQRDFRWSLTGPAAAFAGKGSLLKVGLSWSVPTQPEQVQQLGEVLDLPLDEGPLEAREVRTAFWMALGRQLRHKAATLAAAGQFREASQLLAEHAHTGMELVSFHPAVTAEQGLLNDLALRYRDGQVREDDIKKARQAEGPGRQSEALRLASGSFRQEQAEAAGQWNEGLLRHMRRLRWGSDLRERARSLLEDLWSAAWQHNQPAPELTAEITPDFLRLRLTAAEAWFDPAAWNDRVFRAWSLSQNRGAEVVVLRESLAGEPDLSLDGPARLRFEGPVAVVEFTGAVELANAWQIKAGLLRLASRAYTRQLLDFSGCDYIDSSGLGMLMMLGKTLARSPSGRLVISGLEGPVAKAFSSLGLDNVFTVVPGLTDGLTKF